MTEEEQVLNVRGEEITENSEDHRKIKAEHCNGVPHPNDGENGNVGEEVADSGELDLVTENGAASKEEHKVSGEDVAESQVTVSEWEMVNNEESASSAASNGSAEEILETANTDVVLPASESERAEGQNGAGSVVVLGDNADVTDLAGESETRDYLTNSVEEEGVADHDRLESKNVVVVEECKSKAGAEVAGDEKDAVAVTVVAEEGVADADKSDSEFEVVAVQNGVVRADEDEVPVAVEGVAATTDEKDCENDEDDVSVDTKLGECTEKNEVAVDADTDSDAVSAVSDVRKGESKDAQNVLEKEVVESVSDANVEKSIDGVQNCLLSESAEENKVHVEGEPGKLEVSEEEVIPVVSEDVIKSKVEPSVDATETENNSVDVEGELSNEAVESAAEPSNNAVQSEAELCVDESEAENNAEESGAEPSNNAEESGAEPSNNAEESGAEPSNNALQSESERSVDVSEIENNAWESAAEPSNNALQSEGERCVDVSEMKNSREESEAEPSNNAVQNDGEVSVDVSEMENNPVVGEAKPLNNAVQSEGDLSVDISDVKPNAVDNEAEPSDNAVEGGGEASVDVSKAKNIAVDGEHEPSDNAVESHGGPSVDVSEVKNNAMDGEAETSDKAVPREDEPCVDVSEMKNNTEESKAEPSNDAVQIEAEPCVEVSDMKTNVVEDEAEPSVEGESSNHGDEDSEPAQEGSSADTLHGKNMGTEVVRRPLYYLIRHPRYDDDENFKEQIKIASHLVDEKTKIRDEIRAESQTLKAICRECSQDVRSAVSAERAARDLLRSKRQEMDAVQSTLNRLNNAISVGDITSKIKNIEFMIQHETMLLHEEKELLRQIKQLKQNREELASNMGKQDQSQQSLDDKGSIEENFKLLKKEVEVLRNNVLKTEAATKAARKKYDDESNKLNEVLSRFKAADDIRQEAYAKLQALKKQFYEKSKCFWEYKNAATKAQELAAEGKKDELLCFCDKQVERTMEMWNKNDEFRRDYVRCNTRSTLRRLQTLDGRALGPDEEPPVIPNALTERASKNNSLAPQPLEKETKSMPTESVKIKDEPAPRVVVQRTEASQTTKSNNKKPAKPVVGVSRWGDESDEDTREEPVRTKEEEEQILKAEKAKKDEEAAKLKEKRRLEEIEKAKEAVERKKRIAEKAQQRAAIKAQKEAEQKEKEREKRARRKERRKTAPTDTAENTEQEPAPSSEPLTRNAEECDQIEKPTEVTKKQQKPSQFTRQTKAKSLPMSLRNRGKRRIQPWMWVLIGVLALVALFYLGNNSTLRSSMQGFGF